MAVAGTVNESSESPWAPTFCTIMSTNTPASAIARKTERRDRAGRERERARLRACVSSSSTPAITRSSIPSVLGSLETGGRPVLGVIVQRDKLHGAMPGSRADGGARTLAARPLPIEQERTVNRPQGRHGRGAIDQNADLDLAGRDHLHVDIGVGESLEHHGGDAGVGAHPQADDRNLGHIGVMRDLACAPIARAAVSAARKVSGRSPLATVKLTSVVPPVETFWTIMSTTILAAAIVRKIA